MRAPTFAEVALVQLRSCLVNLPSALARVLADANTAAQDVIVELQFRPAPTSRTSPEPEPPSKSIFLGWTGFNSQRISAIAQTGNSGRNGGRERDIGIVEVDSAFARTNGISEGQKVGVLLHLDPPLAHTVNIEPLTPADWEIIELHANFLETNLQAQVRALPNPNFSGPSPIKIQVHPLTLHLSPTSTANVIVTSLTPSPTSSQSFAKLAPDAEVIVSPKTRSRPVRNTRTDIRSITGASQRSTDGKNGNSNSKHRGGRTDAQRKAIFLRALNSRLYPELVITTEPPMKEKGLNIWVDEESISNKEFRGIEWVCVSIVNPMGIHHPASPQQMQKAKDQEASHSVKHAVGVIARIRPWNSAVASRHALLDSFLCASLGVENMAGGIVRIEAAAAPTPTTSIKTITVFPFPISGQSKQEGLKFGGESRTSREAAVERVRSLYSGPDANGLFYGPVTDGLILPKLSVDIGGFWEGGVVQFDPHSTPVDIKKSPRWCLAPSDKVRFEISHEIPNPFAAQQDAILEEDSIPPEPLTLVGADGLTEKLVSSLRRQCSILINGGPGSGKTSLSRLLGYHMRKYYYYYVAYFDCRKLVTDETRVGSIKDTIDRIFMRATWGCRLGGQSLVILDNLDKLCPVETELQVGGENSRSRQLSELVCTALHRYCTAKSGIVTVATALGKDTLHSVIVGGHVVRDFIDLKAPDKEKRRKILETLTVQPVRASCDEASSAQRTDGTDWLDASAADLAGPTVVADGELGVDRDLDFLDIAGQTDGYMPGDLVLLLSRARSEAIIRTVSRTNASSPMRLTKEDFRRALEGFTPASLRNVTLQSSSVTFASIGGLKQVRDVLLETLQYPNTYAPIFAQCPLRLRSGLLLYGYPGCGKTLLASAVAGECGLNFISVKGPEILNKYIGASEKSVRDLFERAEAARPCVLFFDEFDSIAPKRGHDSTGVTDRVVNQLLTQMDGAEGLSGVYVLAATSRPDLIDPALLRPGRLDKSLLCDMPSLEDRLDIMLALSKKLRMSSDVLDLERDKRNLAEIAELTDGYSGADLQALVYNAHLEAIHDILGDQKGSAQSQRVDEVATKPSRQTLTHKEFIQFRFGEQEDNRESSEQATIGFNRSKYFTERAELVTKVEQLKLSKRKERALRRGSLEHDDRRAGIEDQALDIVIQWKHLKASLASTRSSISAVERQKLRTIYREFVVGRNGEMPTGQGPTEIGARSSLM